MARSSALLAAAVVSATLLAACGEAPPSWDKLITAKIIEQYPAYRVQPVAEGALIVERPNMASRPVDVAALAQFCQRGPKDCNYAIDQLLLELGKP